MVVALTALVVACSGTAVAAGVLITSSSQVGRGVITGDNIQNRTITGKNVQRGSLGSDLLQNGSVGTSKLSSSAQRAIQNSGTSAYEWFRKAGPEANAGGEPSRVITADNVPSGVYAIFAKTIITDLEGFSTLLTPGHTADAHCRLSTGGDIDDGRVLIGTAYGSGPGDVATQITHTFGGLGTITLDCDAGAHWRASDSTIIAVRVGNAPKVEVTG
jgi:hypothetical protein